MGNHLIRDPGTGEVILHNGEPVVLHIAGKGSKPYLEAIRRRREAGAMARRTLLLEDIESFIARRHMAPTKFGRLAANDPRFLLDLRKGRRPGRDVEQRIREWMNGYESALNEEASHK